LFRIVDRIPVLTGFGSDRFHCILLSKMIIHPAQKNPNFKKEKCLKNGPPLSIAILLAPRVLCFVHLVFLLSFNAATMTFNINVDFMELPGYNVFSFNSI
jgi:hypothetical protein